MARRRQIIITKADLLSLQEVLESESAAASDKSNQRALRQQLQKARAVDAIELPPDVVTMNSTIRLRHMADREEETYTLVDPKNANLADGKLSVLAPIGTAILGSRVGDSVRWEVPGGTVRVRIEELLFQPERDGVGV